MRLRRQPEWVQLTVALLGFLWSLALLIVVTVVALAAAIAFFEAEWDRAAALTAALILIQLERSRRGPKEDA